MDSSNQLRGIQLFELGRYKEALKYLAEDSSQLLSRYYLAYCYYELNELDKSETIANSLLGETPNDEDLFALKARIAMKKEQFDEAELHISEAISINPHNANYFGIKGALYFTKKQFETSLDYVNEGLKVDPQNTYCLNLRARLLTKLKQKEAATQTVENILYNNPEDSYSHSNVGWVALENGDTQKALSHFKQALQFDPNNEYARDGMSTALKSKNFIYKWYLKYEFWMANKSTKNQWVFIIGLYIVYRIGVEVLSATGLSYLVIPLIIVYVTFALAGWIMESLSNTILNFDRFGKYLLTADQKRSGYTFLLLLILSVISVGFFYLKNNDLLLLWAVTFLCALIPIPRAFLQRTKKAKLFGFGYGAAMLAVGLTGFLFTSNLYILGVTVIIMLAVFTWIGNTFN